MYEQDYKKKTDAVEGYQLKLYTSRTLMLFFWAGVIIITCGSFSLLSDVRNTGQFLAVLFFFLMEISIPLIGAICLTNSYILEKKEYLLISREGIGFYQSSFFRDDVQRHITWEKIDEITIFPETKKRLFGYGISIADNTSYNPVYYFSLYWTERPKKIVKVLKEYSSGNVKIGVKGYWSFKYKWY